MPAGLGGSIVALVLLGAGVTVVGAPSPGANVTARAHVLSTGRVARGWSRAVDTGLAANAVGFDWSGATNAAIEVRARGADGWGPWIRVAGDPDEGPDRGSREDRGRTSAGPVWVGRDVRQTEVRVIDGEPADLTLHAIRSDDTGTGLQPAALTAPRITTRAAWGADESFRRSAPGCDGTPQYARAVRFAVVHHTVSANDYQPGDAAALVRAIYYFHTHTNGWCDIGYNFLVDRYGQVFEGRFGGIASAVIGAHATNFNTGSTGVALLGTFAKDQVPSAMLTALEGLLAWKMALHGINPLGKVEVNGRVVPALAGHRDLGATECPGDIAFGLLSQIRSDVAAAVTRLSGPTRVGVVGSCGDAQVRDGPLTGPFSQQLGCGDAQALSLGGARVGVINSCGAGYVKEGDLSGPFNVQLNCGDARSITVTSERLGVITSCGAGYVKEGPLSGPFNQVLGCADARAVTLGGTSSTQPRLGVINGCGAAYVKEGPLSGPFNLQLNCGDALAVAVTDSRVGVINSCGAFYVKEGPLSSPFRQQTGCGDTKAIALWGDRVAVINGCGSLYVKAGELGAPFQQQTACADAWAATVAGDRVGVVTGCGAALVKEGPLSSAFVVQLPCGQARSLALTGW